jgi:hypothetical protein
MARKHLAALLNEADRNGAVVIERRDVQYVITARRATPASRRRQSIIETVDPAIDTGQWEWTATAKGARFKARRRRS